MTIDTAEVAGGPDALRLEAPGPWVESPFFAGALASRQLGEAERELAIRYHQDGCVMLPGLVDAETCDAIREEIASLFLPPFQMGRSERRVPDAWRYSPAAQALATHPRIMSLLRLLYGRSPLPFQTLHFSVGSQQRAHSDSIHFSSLPARYMCGVWVALEDVDLASGPLFYYPGSHRLPELDYQDLGLKLDGLYGSSYEAYEDLMERLMVNVGLEQHKLVVSRGDALVWSSNLIHGGSPILRGGASRWSQVTHYLFEDCIYYTPMLSNRVTGELALRNTMVDIASGQLMVHSYNGAKIIGAETSGGRYRIAIVEEEE
ncbi:MAG TPA: phytanoyl-CoA dioxygenase family protein [Acidimicrobiales bacterium]|nr:phytanoyl-CoA dioxygenase family protein [Acidimicrobiales bacterium]